MILIDLSGFAIANVMENMKTSGTNSTNEAYLRHMMLNSIKAINKKFSKKYGEIILCLDCKNTWRKDFFPYYKANRKKNRDASLYDWKEIFSQIDKIILEIKEIFPYKVVKVEGLEADDVIAILAKNAPSLTKENILGEMEHPCLVVSNDKDMVQLKKYKWVKIWAPRKQKMVEDGLDYSLILMEHILKGDTADGIPNILSESDILVSEPRRKQKSVTEKFKKMFYKEGVSCLTPLEKQSYDDNKTFIDLECIPAKYEKIVI